jgi:cobalt-zinc-cadmium efflux system outer membrane protein
MATLPIGPGRRSHAGVRRAALAWAVALAWLTLASEAGAQAPTVNTDVPRLPGGVGTSLGPSPGAGNSALGMSPGAGGGAMGPNLPSAGVLGGRPGPYAPKGVPVSITTPGGGQGPTALQMPITAPQPAPIGPTTTPFYGTLELPAQEEDEPADGLTLEQAIDVTLKNSLDLRQKFIEIPMARADILQASLRANPVFYQDGQLLQYQRGEFNRSRPGGPQQFDTNVTYPLDVSGKRRARTEVTNRALKVLEAQYQDAVRNRIDDVYDAFVTALNARQTLRYARESVRGLGVLLTLTQKLFSAGGATQLELDRVENQVRVARLGLIDAEAGYRKARLDLGSLMNLPIDRGSQLKISGKIDVEPSPLPPVEELRRVALEDRPDIVAFRLGVSRAHADVRLARANAYSDVYVLWQPYTFQDNSPYGVKSATSWALGVTVPLPIYNRNQGGILRAKMNVDQSKLELADVERQALIDVEKALQEFEVSRRLIQELQEEIMPDAKEILEKTYRLREAGSVSFIEVINAQLDYNDKVKQYLDTAIRYRRSMLSINTVVGKTVMP